MWGGGGGVNITVQTLNCDKPFRTTEVIICSVERLRVVAVLSCSLCSFFSRQVKMDGFLVILRPFNSISMKLMGRW